MHVEQLPAQFSFCCFGWPAELLFGQFNPEFLRDRTHRFGKGDVLDLLHEAEDIARCAAAKTMKKLFGCMNRKRWRLFLMKGAEAAKVLRARLFQRDVIADDADNVSLLLHGICEIAG